uniref:NADH-ubiquinone oxidoreductase chain 5 n=1 Tax=Ebrechtella tricuspidata TaxID=1112414 RepID=A0A1S5RUT0_9ARAC|nr:NADH dehydrogenase subunit 5 [Ebrechtella tricuspidata]
MMLLFALPPLTASLYMLYYSIFISIEFPLISIFSFNIPISFLLDWTSLLFLFTVMFISGMILLFSMEYIPPLEHKQFSLMLLSFVLSMSFLILSDNIIFILLGWDGLGTSSYILVIYYQNSSSAASGSITLLTNRLGDIFILLSISMLIYLFNWEFNINKDFNMMIMILLMLAACTKSAQFPFSAWLPMAMSAPTPISALVHSSTLVTAGVFLMIRIMDSPHTMTMFTLMIISSFTTLYASMSANWEQDLKKVIALSTLSQMAMMMFAVSIFSVILAYFHLIIHAFFKSLMFMCAGVMIHESNYQDMRKMSMSSKFMPMISTTLSITSMALMGIPFMSGFFSKDSIIEKMISGNLESISCMLMIMSIGLTASYSLRMIKLSNNLMMKMKIDSSNHLNYHPNISISLMTPMSIILGSLFMWMINPIKLVMLFPMMFKLMIIFTIIMGLFLGMMLSFKTHLYKSFGQPGISLWFIHFMSTKLMNIISPFMKNFFLVDKSWRELYGPKTMFSSILLMSNKSEMYKSILLMTSLILMILPLIMMI